MDKFTPSSEQAHEYADEYWKEQLSNREEVLKSIQSKILANSKRGSYKIVSKILKTDQEFLKEILEDAGYKIIFSQCPDGEEFAYINILFE